MATMKTHAALLTIFGLAAASVDARTTAPPSSGSLHDYVLGRYATANADQELAARYFDAARTSTPGDAQLTRRAFDVALAAGDRARAVGLAGALAATDQSDSTVALVRLADAVLRRDWAAADLARGGLADAGFAAVVGPIVEAWVLQGRGRTIDALAKLDPANFTGFARSYVAEQRAHMLAATGRHAEAASAYRDLLAGTGAGINFLRVGLADAQAMAGDRAGAEKTLAAGGDELPVRAALARLMAGKRIGALAPDARRGIGWLTARLASDLARDKPVALALVFARVGTFLAPDIAATWLICGDVLARSGQADGALAAYAMVSSGDALRPAADVRSAEVLESAGRAPAAGAVLKAAAAARGARAEDWRRLADWHRRAEDWAAAIDGYGRAIALAGPGEDIWPLYFFRGSARERSGDWTGGETDLREALKRAPDEPVVLNYLGYSMLDRGERLGEATALIERAAKLRPGDGGVIDSLGWALYRQGRYAEAVTTLERASGLESVDPTITEHLGDGYWRIGRRIDARFRWRAALDLGPSARQKTAIMAKLDYGLDAALAMVPETR